LRGLIEDLKDRFLKNLKLEKLGSSQHILLSYKADLPVAYVSVSFGIGASLEDFRMAGVSHFIEHLVFKGSSRFGVGEVAEFINSLGGYLNAYTSYDHTNFYSIVPVENLDRVLDALYDMTMMATFPPEEVEREREVVLEEIRQSEDDPFNKAFKRAMELAFPNHPFGKPILGYFDTVSSMTREEITSFWERYYGPSNSVTLVVSPLEHEQVRSVVLELINKITRNSETSFEDYLRKMKGLKSLLPQEERIDTFTEIISSDLNKSYVVGIRRGLDLSLPDYPHQDMALMVLSWGRSAPLKVKLKEELKLADYLSLEDFPIGDVSIIILSAITDRDKVDNLKSEYDNLLTSFIPSEEMIDKVRNLLLYSELSSLESSESIGIKILEGYLVGNPLWFLEEVQRIVSLEFKNEYLRALEFPIWVINQ